MLRDPLFYLTFALLVLTSCLGFYFFKSSRTHHFADSAALQKTEQGTSDIQTNSQEPKVLLEDRKSKKELEIAMDKILDHEHGTTGDEKMGALDSSTNSGQHARETEVLMSQFSELPFEARAVYVQGKLAELKEEDYPQRMALVVMLDNMSQVNPATTQLALNELDPGNLSKIPASSTWKAKYAKQLAATALHSADPTDPQIYSELRAAAAAQNDEALRQVILNQIPP